MNPLIIAATEDTPNIEFDKVKGVFKISGRSLPEDAAGFFRPVLDWLESYKSQANSTTDFIVNLEYFNTASSKLILDILSKIEDVAGAKVIWHHYADDEDMKEAGEEFAELIELPFQFQSN